MAQNITISHTTGTRALLTALFAVIVLLITRMTKNALALLKAALKTVCQWLQTKHSFYGQDGDPIQCTGWQFVGYNIMAAAATLLLCIEF